MQTHNLSDTLATLIVWTLLAFLFTGAFYVLFVAPPPAAFAPPVSIHAVATSPQDYDGRHIAVVGTVVTISLNEPEGTVIEVAGAEHSRICVLLPGKQQVEVGMHLFAAGRFGTAVVGDLELVHTLDCRQGIFELRP